MDDQNHILDEEEMEKRSYVEEYNIVSTNKFILLSIASFGMYEFWWIYKAWRFFKKEDNLDIMPAMRAFFSILFLYSLFQTIKEFAQKEGHTESYSSGALFVGFFIFGLLGRLPDPYWLISFFGFAFLIPPFSALNRALVNSETYFDKEQEGFSTRQIILLVIGGFLWAIVLIGLMMGEEM
ncbi:MAG: hypothetical protein IPJ00_22780 [Saprospirales bacterium]|nr:hypothetical protein [Saprospirales bacterium]